MPDKLNSFNTPSTTSGYTARPIVQPTSGGGNTSGIASNTLPQRNSDSPNTGRRGPPPTRPIEDYHHLTSNWSSTQLTGIRNIEELIVEATELVKDAEGNSVPKHPQLEGFVTWVLDQKPEDLQKKLTECNGNANRIAVEWMTTLPEYRPHVVKVADFVVKDMETTNGPSSGLFKADFDAVVRQKASTGTLNGQTDPAEILANKYWLGDSNRSHEIENMVVAFDVVESYWGTLLEAPPAAGGA